ncbi:hypothetical protein M0657_008342 [Pyricularia oryzae]|nr:hypothetical protein M0657_008342 [Pyricularia oryzae]KAI7928855.1 hypothetical protein M9X92_001649 [Pyricularia oryzae]
MEKSRVDASKVIGRLGGSRFTGQSWYCSIRAVFDMPRIDNGRKARCYLTDQSADLYSSTWCWFEWKLGKTSVVQQTLNKHRDACGEHWEDYAARSIVLRGQLSTLVVLDVLHRVNDLETGCRGPPPQVCGRMAVSWR